MTILAVHRKEPGWPADPARPIFHIDAFFVETDGPEPTAQEVDDHLNPPPPPIVLTTAEIQERIEAEGGWDTYVNFMFATPLRRNAFVKNMFIGKLQINGNGFVTSLQGAGFTAPQIARITARPVAAPRMP